MYRKCHSCGCLIDGKAYAVETDVNVGKIGWGWGWSQRGKFRYTSNRKIYKKKIVYYCENCNYLSVKKFWWGIVFIILMSSYLYFFEFKGLDLNNKIVDQHNTPKIYIDNVKNDSAPDFGSASHEVSQETNPINAEENESIVKKLTPHDSSSLEGNKTNQDNPTDSN